MTLFERPAIYLVTAGKATQDNFEDESRIILENLTVAVAHGIDLIQIREKKLSDKLVYELAKRAAQLTHDSDTKLLVNDRADIAHAAQADGVQLTSVSAPTEAIRRAFGDEFLIGVSTHDLDVTLRAKNDGANFAVFGPVFSTPGKPNEQGTNALRDLCSATAPFPVIAIGGIDAENAVSAIGSGAAGVAAIRALSDKANTASFVKRFRYV